MTKLRGFDGSNYGHIIKMLPAGKRFAEFGSIEGFADWWTRSRLW